MTPVEPVAPPTREDPTVPPAVTIKQSTVVQDGINVALFTVMESGNAYAVEDSYDMAVQDARSIFGEDVNITTGDAPAPVATPTTPAASVVEGNTVTTTVPPDPSVPDAGPPAAPTVATDPTTPA